MNPATLRTTSSAAGFLWARLIHLQYAAFYVEPVHLSDSSRYVVARPEFNKSETA
jgi:hypothetical protein